MIKVYKNWCLSPQSTLGARAPPSFQLSHLQLFRHRQAPHNSTDTVHFIQTSNASHPVQPSANFCHSLLLSISFTFRQSVPVSETMFNKIALACASLLISGGHGGVCEHSAKAAPGVHYGRCSNEVRTACQKDPENCLKLDKFKMKHYEKTGCLFTGPEADHKDDVDQTVCCKGICCQKSSDICDG